MRAKQSLAGLWQFQIDPEGLVRVDHLTPDRSIQVPMPWQAAFPELETYSGYAWYAQDVDLDDQWLSGEVLLSFGAVDYWCEIFVNGQRVGEHEGGYTAFEFAIRPYVRSGKNQIAVRVYDAAYPGMMVPRWYDESNQQTDGPFNPVHIPQGKQSWYFECGGIWQDVTLTAVPAVYIDLIHVTPDIHTGSAAVQVSVKGDLGQASGTLTAAIGATAARAQLVAGQGQYELVVNVPQPALWTPETPNLYMVTATLASSNGEDTETAHFGFREIAILDGQLLLNGEPIFLLAALDQDMYPKTIYTVPSEAFLRDEFQKAKELGLNCLRCHIKPPDPLYLDLADEMGLLVWAEIPSWRTFYVRTTLQESRFNVTDDIKARANQTLREMIARDFNHPSLVIWSIVNEDWGTATNLSPGDRAWLAEMYDVCKALDPTRLAVDNSACIINLHVKSDLDDYHVYANIPDSADFFEQFIENFSRRAGWSYSSHGDAQRRGDEPLILSEFGNWGLPSIEALRDADGNVPDWFKLGPWWSGWEGEPGWPKGTLERFKGLGLKAIWGDYEAFAKASQWHQYQAMKFEIEVMRRQALLRGYVITELSDIYWESNGLLDFNRGKKVYHDVFAAINAPDVVIPRLRRYATWDDQPLPIQIYGSHYSSADWSETSLKLSLNGQTLEQTLPILSRGSVTDLGVQELRFAPVPHAENQSVDLRIVDPAGVSLAANNVEILVLPAAARQAGFSGQLTVVGESDPLLNGVETSSALAGALQKMGYSASAEFAPDALIVTGLPTESALRHVRDGGKMLYLANGIGPFFWWQGRGGVYSGNWMSSFNWLRPDVYPRLQVSNLNPLTMPFLGMTPVAVLGSLPVNDPAVQGDFLAGQITGWVGHSAVHTAQFRYGLGTVIMTTYPLEAVLSAASPHPIGVAMLHDLIEYLASDRCKPTLIANL